MGERREHICLVTPPSSHALLPDNTSFRATYWEMINEAAVDDLYLSGTLLYTYCKQTLHM